MNRRAVVLRVACTPSCISYPSRNSAESRRLRGLRVATCSFLIDGENNNNSAAGLAVAAGERPRLGGWGPGRSEIYTYLPALPRSYPHKGTDGVTARRACAGGA